MFIDIKDIGLIINKLKQSLIGILPTDTIYGIHCLALNKSLVEKVYQIKQREINKPFVILISDIKQLLVFNITLTDRQKQFCSKYWPGRISMVFNCDNSQFEYLHRGQKKLAFRIPDNRLLQSIVSKTGPLISTSANLSGNPVEDNIIKIEKELGSKVGFYVDGGVLDNLPSTVVDLTEKEVKILREGAVKIDDNDLS